MLLHRLALPSMSLLLGLGLAACGDDAQDETLPVPTLPASICDPGEVDIGEGGCVAAGVHPEGCEAGLSPRDGDCVPAGVPPEGCGEGFLTDGQSGCVALSPSEPCPAGQMALPGDDACHGLGPCGGEPWGDVQAPVGSQYVDQGYAGSDSDGSAERPWQSVQQGVDAAEAGAVVVVAAGSYAEDVIVSGKAVKIVGRCASLVELTGTESGSAAIVVSGGASGAEIHGVSVTGPRSGLEVTRVADIVLERLWVHDTAGHGVRLIGGQSSLALRGSLVERTEDRGLYVEGGRLTVEDSSVRDVAATGTPGESGRCINLREDLDSGARGSLTLRRSRVERCRNVGVLVHDGDGVVEETLIRDIRPEGDRYGRGLQVQAWSSQGHEVATLQLRRSVIEQTFDGGLVISGADAEVEHAVVRDVAVDLGTGIRGYGIAVQSEGDLTASLRLRSSLVERTHEAGLLLLSGHAEVESTLVRDVSPSSGGLTGRGLSAQSGAVAGEPSDVRMSFSEVRRTVEAGVFVESSTAALEGCLIAETRPRPADGWFGRGLVVQRDPETHEPAQLDLRFSAIRSSGDLGVFLQAADAVLVGTAVEDSRGDEAGNGGIGIGVEATVAGESGTTQLDGVRVAGARTMGMAVFGSPATLTRVVVEEVEPQVADGLFGDGLAVLSYFERADVTLTDGLIRSCARAGIVSFGAATALGTVSLECNGLDLAAQPYAGVAPFFHDLTGNRCGCGTDQRRCQVLSSTLEPPEPSGGL